MPNELKTVTFKRPTIIVRENWQPWAGVCLGVNRLFSKTVKGKILNFLHEVEKIISVISGKV